jgi:hypothetical protein
MREVWIRNRPDGVTELSPTLAPLAREERWIIAYSVAMVAAGFFMSGALPAPMLAAVLVSCVAGEVVLGAKVLLLALLRPRAEVVEIPTGHLRRRAR